MPPLPRPITSVHPTPVDERGLADRLGWTLLGAVEFLLFVPAVVLTVLTLVSVVTGPAGIGLLLAVAVVPATAALTGVHRRIAGGILDAEVAAVYADTTGRGILGRPLRWLRDPGRWRDVAYLAFSATGGAILSGLPPLLLVTPVVYLIGFLVDTSLTWLLMLLFSAVCPLAWWLVTPALVRARALAGRGILGHGRVADLERRVEEVSVSRSETLDHAAAELRRIERDLHDGAQARIAAVGMNVGLAERILGSDPEAAAALLREARETSLSALDDLRSVVRGIHPPVLADHGLAGGIEALALALPLPVTLAIELPGRLPSPVESAAYFAVAECLANVAKHAGAGRAWITARHDGSVLRVVVGDDGGGGADEHGSGLSGLARRLGAFDGTMTVSSPPGGPTEVTMEVPCPTTVPPSAPSSPRTRPSSESD